MLEQYFQNQIKKIICSTSTLTSLENKTRQDIQNGGTINAMRKINFNNLYHLKMEELRLSTKINYQIRKIVKLKTPIELNNERNSTTLKENQSNSKPSMS